MLVVTQTYAVIPAAQEEHEVLDQLREAWAKQLTLEDQEWWQRQDPDWKQHLWRQRQLQRQVKYLEEHPNCKNKINRLKLKLVDLLDLSGREEDALRRRLLDTTDEVADAHREALLALDATSFDNPSKTIQEEAKKVRHSIIKDGDNTVPYLLALLKMLKNKTPINE